MKNSVTITVNGNKSYNLTDQVISLYVEHEFNRIPRAEIAFITGSFSERTFPLFEDKNFALGKPIDISIRYETPGAKDTLLFGGIISKRMAEVNNNKPVLKLLLKDPATELHNAVTTQIYSDKSDADIVKQVLSKYKGLSLAKNGADNLNHFQFDQLVQKQWPDWDFILQRITENGLLLNIKNGVFNTQSYKPSGSKKLTLDLGVDQNIIDFTLSENGEGLYQSVIIEFWDQKKNKTDRVDKKFSDQAAKQINAPRSTFIFPQITSKKQAQAMLKCFELYQQLNAFSGNVKIVGDPNIELGQQLILNNFPDKNKGPFTITGLIHELRAGQWTTKLQLGNIKLPFKNLLQGDLQSVQSNLGVEIGIVKKWQKDPDKLGRIAVEVPAFGKDTYWAYSGQFYAGEKQGSYFPPQQDDQVIIGFINNNASLGVILTSVYKSNAPLPEPFKRDENSPIGIVSKDFSFIYDDKKKTFTLNTGKSNKLIFDNKNGISMETQKDLNLNSSAKVKVTAKTTMDIKGKVINLN